MSKFYRPFRLIHLDRRIFHVSGVKEMARVIINDPYAIKYAAQFGDYRYGCSQAMAGLGDKPFNRVRDSNMSEVWESHFNVHRWILRDSSDLIVPLWWIESELRAAGFKARCTIPWIWHPQWYRLNWVPGAGTGRGKRRHFRRPKHVSQHKAVVASEEELFDNGYDVPRRRMNVPTAWDDVPRNYDRSWKRARKTQYRIKP